MEAGLVRLKDRSYSWLCGMSSRQERVLSRLELVVLLGRYSLEGRREI